MNLSLHSSCSSSLSCLKLSVFQRGEDSRFFGQDREDEQDKGKYKENVSCVASVFILFILSILSKISRISEG